MKTRIEKNQKIDKEIRLNERKEKKEKRKRKKKKMLIIIIILILLTILYGRLVEPNILLVHEHKITSNEISNSFHGIKIVHFSDLHYGMTNNNKNINKVVNKINELKPDIVIFTGDLIEENYKMNDKEIKVLTEALNNIKYTLGKYAVIGNHDNNDYFLSILDGGNFSVLKNNYDIIYNKDNNPIVIYGVDDLTIGKPDLALLDDYKIKDIGYKIVAVHEGDYVDDILNDYNVNLVLAGHSHNGQVNIPFITKFFLPYGAKKYYKPYYNIDNTDIYISNGLGSSSLKFRFGSPPSINLYRLNKSK